MKANEIKHCALCGRGVMHAGAFIFYRVTFQPMGVLVTEVQRVHAMQQFMHGNVAIAQAFYDPEVAAEVHPPVESLVCQSCALEPHVLARLAEETK
jgi:hypothetical protein